MQALEKATQLDSVNIKGADDTMKLINARDFDLTPYGNKVLTDEDRAIIYAVFPKLNRGKKWKLESLGYQNNPYIPNWRRLWRKTSGSGPNRKVWYE